MAGLRGNTYLEGDVLATYPRDEVRGTVLTRTLALGAAPVLSMEVGADRGRSWQLDIYAGNTRLESKLVTGDTQLTWQKVEVSLAAYANKTTTLRLYQRVLLGPGKAPGNAYWRRLEVR
jgi:hypothetical protein